MILLRTRQLVLASLALVLAPSAAFAQANAATPDVVDFAAAEALVAKAPRLPKHPVFAAVRLSPDGNQCAWIVVHRDMMTAATANKPDAIEVVVEDVATRVARSTCFDVAFPGGHDRRCGPVWTADGSVLVAYDVGGGATALEACVDLVRNGEAKPLLREADASVTSIAGSAAGTVAIVLGRVWPGASRVLVCGADGAVRATIDTSKLDCVAAAPSPDGRWIALLAQRQIAVVAATGGEPRKLATLKRANSDIVIGCDVPTWLADSKSFVVAAGDDVVHVDVANGELRRWSAATLGGSAVDVVMLPGDTIAGVIALHQTDANLADVIMHAGCASKSTYLDLVWLDLKTGKSQRSSIANKWVVDCWFDMPKVGWLAARFGR